MNEPKSASDSGTLLELFDTCRKKADAAAGSASGAQVLTQRGRLPNEVSIRKRRVYDCFLYFGELDVLRIRCHELAEVVDYFVVVESNTTHSGQSRPVHYNPAEPSLAPFVSKIRHVVVTDMPTTNEHVKREEWQRNAVLRGVSDAGVHDLIMMSDVDEIPRAAVVQQMAADTGNRIFGIEIAFYYFFVNYRNIAGPEAKRVWGVAAERGVLLQISPEELRTGVRKGDIPAHVLQDAGWHFSYLGDELATRRKIAAFSHQEYNKEEFLSTVDIARLVRNGEDLYKRPGYRWELIETSDLPAWLKSQPDLMKRFYCPVERAEPSFTSDRFSHNVPEWNRVVAPHLQMAKAPCVLEIGAFEGRASLWFLANFPELRLTVIDPWDDRSEPAAEKSSARFMRNIEAYANRVTVIKGKSEFARTLAVGSFDLVYVDGDHTSAAVLHDGVQGYELLRPGGLLIFDNYMGGDHSPMYPKPAIDAFHQAYAAVKKIALVSNGYQRIYRKLPEAGIDREAASLIQTGKADEALKILSSALRAKETSELWNDWACAALACNKADLAESGYRRALQIEPTHRQAAVNLAALLLGQLRFEESVPILQSLAGRLTDEEKRALRQLANRTTADRHAAAFCNSGAVPQPAQNSAPLPATEKTLKDALASFLKGFGYQKVDFYEPAPNESDRIARQSRVIIFAEK